MSELAPAKPTKLDAAEIITGLAASAEYQRNKEYKYPLQRQIARTALELAGMDEAIFSEDDYEFDSRDATPETALHAVVGLLPSYVYALEGIRHDKTVQRLDAADYRSMKKRGAHFNHAIKSLIEQDPSLTFSNVVETVMNLYGMMNRDRWGDDRKGFESEARWFRTYFEGAMRGMEQEVLARQIIEEINRACPLKDPATGKKIPRVSVDPHVSAEDDLKGTDLYVTLEGVTFPIDIKASERTAENVRRKHTRAKDSHSPAKDFHNKAIITTGISHVEMHNALRVSPNRAFKAAPAMLDKLYAARQEYLDKHATTPAEELAMAA